MHPPDQRRRRKPPKATKEEQLAAAALAEGKARGGDDDRTATDTDDDNLSSIAGLSALSSKAKRNQLSVQELGVSLELRRGWGHEDGSSVWGWGRDRRIDMQASTQAGTDTEKQISPVFGEDGVLLCWSKSKRQDEPLRAGC